jgi:hypothetical protein
LANWAREYALLFHTFFQSWYAQSNIISEIQLIMGLLLDFLDSVLPGPEEASPPNQQKYTAI